MIKGKMTETVMEMSLREYMLWVACEKRTVWTSALTTLLAACLFSGTAAEGTGWFLILIASFFILTTLIQILIAVTIAGTQPVDSS